MLEASALFNRYIYNFLRLKKLQFLLFYKKGGSISMNKYICVGTYKNYQGKWYRHINVETLVVEDSLSLKDKDFNEKKYSDFVQNDNSKNVYTVIAEIVFDIKKNSKSNLRGYLVLHNNTICPILTSYEGLLNILKNNFCMNYSLTTVNNVKYLKKNSNVEVLKIDNKYLKGKLDYSLEDVSLNKEMSDPALRFCMEYNGFKLSHEEKWEGDYFGRKLPFVSQIWVNKDGDIIILNLVYDTSTGLYNLNYFHNIYMALRHVNEKEYGKTMSKYRYLGFSTIPLQNEKDDLTLFYTSEFYRFMSLNKFFNEFTTPCIPFYCDKKLYAASTLLPLLPNKRDWLNNVANPIIKEKYSKYYDYDIDYALRLLLGWQTLKYPKVNIMYTLYDKYRINKTLPDFVELLKERLGNKKEIDIAVRIFAEGLKTGFKA